MGSSELVRRLEQRPSEEKMTIAPDTKMWELLNCQAEKLASDIHDDEFLQRRQSSAAASGKHGFWRDFDEEAMENLRSAAELDNGDFFKFVRKHCLTFILARVILVDSTESMFDWHVDSTHAKVAKDSVIWHMNWMVSEDYSPGTLMEHDVCADSTPSVITNLMANPGDCVRIRYLCGDDVFAMDHGAEVRDHHRDKRSRAYLRVWDTSGSGIEEKFLS